MRKGSKFLPKFVKKPGGYQVLFNYTGGGHRLDIAWVELTENGKTISRDKHEGTTGARDKANAYAIKLETLKPGARYSLKASVRSDEGVDSNGEIHLVAGMGR